MLIPVFLPIQTYPVKVEKDDIDLFTFHVRRYARQFTTLVILSTILLHLILWLIISPALLTVYPDLGLIAPAHLTSSFMLVPLMVGVVLLAYLLLLDPLNSAEVERLRQVDDILISVDAPIINATVTVFPIIYMVFTVMFLMLTLIIPIYSISSLLS